MTDGLVVAVNRGNAREAKEPYCLTNLLTKGRQGRDDKAVHRTAGTKEKDIPKSEV
ncbi:MAG: hypothetical protein MUP02_05040 [Actinobacteria bacterium]|nr:hypothetical protein [Actinomycetota bacterium]